MRPGNRPRASAGGVLERPGHTEAGVDLCRMAGLSGAALLCEVVTPDRRDMMRRDGLVQLAAEHAIPMITIADLRAWRARAEGTVTRSGHASLPTEVGEFEAIAYTSPREDVEHLALVMGDVRAADAPLVRVHSECLTGDLAGSLRCDCGAQFRSALSAIADVGTGVLIYLGGHEGRGFGLGHKLREHIWENLSLDAARLDEYADGYVSAPHVMSIFEESYPWVVTLIEPVATSEGEQWVAVDIGCSNISGYINNYTIGDDCIISNVCTMETTDGATARSACGSTTSRIDCARVMPRLSAASFCPRGMLRMPARKISANAAALATVSGNTSFHSSGRLSP